jgi:hypothetical protein
MLLSVVNVLPPHHAVPPRSGMMASRQFHYEAAVDGYRCPQGQLLAYTTTDRTGYRHYKSDPTVRPACPLLASCASNRSAGRLIIRHVWADARERADVHRLTPWGKRIYKRRKETVERSFADAKQLTVTRAFAACLPSLANACSPQPPRTSRKSPSLVPVCNRLDCVYRFRRRLLECVPMEFRIGPFRGVTRDRNMSFDDHLCARGYFQVDRFALDDFDGLTVERSEE